MSSQLCGALAGLLLAGGSLAAEVLPPAPAHYFNDYANVVPSATAQQLNAKLEDFERTASCQVLVAVFPKMQSASSLEDYTHQLATAWKIGQKSKNNGVGLFVFIQDRKMRIEVGYGLEGALPDALAKRIIEDEIKPYFKSGDFSGGLTAGVTAILKATQGEYKGAGRTVASQYRQKVEDKIPVILIFTFVIIFLLISLFRPLLPRGHVYHSGGGVFWSGGGSSGGGGSDWGGGGGFSGGGGSFGGGGASGSW